MGAGRLRARRGSGSVRVRNGRLLAQISLNTDLNTDPSGRRIRRSKTFDSRTQAEAWIATQQLETASSRTRSWRTASPTTCGGGSPSKHRRASPAVGLARTTLAHYRVVVERHLIPELGHRKVGALTVRELDAFASLKLAAGYAPATVNRMRETLRSALSTAVRQDRLLRNVARYGVTAASARRLS